MIHPLPDLVIILWLLLITAVLIYLLTASTV